MHTCGSKGNVADGFNNNKGAQYGLLKGSGRITGKHVPLLPKNMHKSFWERFKEWWK